MMPVGELLAKTVITLAVIGYVLIAEPSGEAALIGGIVGYWLREGERAALRTVYYTPASGGVPPPGGAPHGPPPPGDRETSLTSADYGPRIVRDRDREASS